MHKPLFEHKNFSISFYERSEKKIATYARNLTIFMQQSGSSQKKITNKVVPFFFSLSNVHSLNHKIKHVKTYD